jgi:hypothetical protein
MSKFTVIEYMDPAGDVDTIEVDLAWPLADVQLLLAYQTRRHETQWKEKFGPSDYFNRQYPLMMAVIADAKRRFGNGTPIDELTIIDWQE